MRDRIHQPYRAPITPLLPLLLPLVGSHGISGVALSGAGPAVLVIVNGEEGGEESLADASKAVEKAAENRMGMELLVCRFSGVGACQAVEK
jgi:homoserine kinase